MSSCAEAKNRCVRFNESIDDAAQSMLQKTFMA